MNHIYRSIWNSRTGTFTAVSEHAKTGGKQASAGTSVVTSAGFALKVLTASLLLAFGSASYALPVGGVVVAGSATVTSGNGSMTVNQSSQNAVLNWQSFNIGAVEAVRFVQPNSSSVALNRVVGADPSSILGSLTANGKVFLVNPNGILFGKGASVNVGGLVASTLNISDSDFMAGNYTFAGTDGSVLNQGSIHADGGYVALLGANVSNEGIINARLGSVALAAGNAITLDVAGDGLLNVAVNEGAVHALVSNGGMIQADGGQVLMTAQAAGNLLQTAVNNTGVIQAQAIENHGGVIKLLGDMQSGTVNVGGKLDASAPDGGNGGFIETSAAHVKVGNGARITTSASQGLTGSWLIDPTDYTIAATGGDITGAQLSTNLGSSNITILSTSGGSGSNGDVNVNDIVTWSANRLTLNAQNNININTEMNASGTASLALQYGQGAVAAGNTSKVNVNAPINLPAGNNFSTKLGSDGSVKAYTVITDLGAAGDTGANSLQGINGNLAGNYVLGANIDASTTSGWNDGSGFDPLGKAELDPDPFNPFDSPIAATPFTGTFDGLGHTINALTINRSSEDGVGLFGQTSGANLRNVGLVDGSITGNSHVGSLVGDSQYSTISQVYATSAVNGGEVVGGLVGNSQGSAISGAYTTGTVSGSGAGVGGLVGQNINTPISQAYATGAVHGGYYVGGLLGYNLSGSTITGAYATGAVTGNTTGGLIGSNASGGAITAGYWDSYSTGQTAGAGYGSVTGISAVTSDPTRSGDANYAFKQSAYAGLDFTAGTGDWFMVDGSTRPFLRSEYSTTVSNTHQLQLMAMDLAASYIVARDIDASATARSVNSAAAADVAGMWSNAGFAPLGTAADFSGGDFTPAAPFTGRLDGLGHTISGLTINLPATSGVGMFGQANGANIRNIGLLGGSIMGNNYVGGVVGENSSNTISGVYSTVAVSATGNVAGGLVGNSQSSTISESYATGTVSGGNGVGGLVGQSQTDTISDVYATGAVSGDIQVGGLIGYYYGGTITEAYATGAISGGSEVGGLIGYLHPASSPINGGYWNIDSSGRMNGVGSGSATGITGLTATQMKTASAFSGLDLTNTWVIYDTYTNPLLRSFMTALTVTANSATKNYDGAAYSGGNGITYSTVPNGNLLGSVSYAGSAQGAVNAGSYKITPGGFYSNQQGYLISFVDGTLTVNTTGVPTGTTATASPAVTVTNPRRQNAIASAASITSAPPLQGGMVDAQLPMLLNVSDAFPLSGFNGLPLSITDNGVKLPSVAQSVNERQDRQ